MDIIFLEKVRLATWIGVYDWERQSQQTIELSLEIGLPQRGAAQSDALADTIDYAAVLQYLRDDLAERHFALIEALAEHIADIVLRHFGAAMVRIELSKPGILRQVGRVGIKIERHR